MDDLEFKKFLKFFWNKKIKIIVIMFFVILIGLMYSYYGRKTQYETYATVLIKQGINEKESDSYAKNLANTYVELISSKTIINEAIEKLNIKGNSGYDVSAFNVTNTDIVKITVINSNSENLAKVVNKLVEITNKKIKDIYGIEEIYIIDEASESQISSNINHTRDILVASFLGIIIVLIYVMLKYIWEENK